VRDGFLIVEGALYLENSSRQVVLSRAEAQGLRFPIPLPAVFGDSLDQGMLPPETSARHRSLNTDPKNGRLVFRDGAVWYDGPRFPGVKQTIQLRYALPITDERMDLAFRSDVPLTSLMISSMWSDRVAPRVVPDRSFVVREGRRGENIQRLIRVDDLPPVGEAMVLRVDHLPRPLVVQTYVAGIGVLLLLAAFGLAVMSGRARDV
ncbi:MAG: hypothetical protein VX938_00285, partial [Myxococcota bacterium]|nr:hypothetical protein [Myxococcota bacterium]